jgi:phosphoglycerol transferase MdoB-like AlkP superfamily enzyme
MAKRSLDLSSLSLPLRFTEPRIGLPQHLAYTLLSALLLLVMYASLRLALLVHNSELIGTTPASVFVEAFINGLRFDLRLVVFAVFPLLLAILSLKLMRFRNWMHAWLVIFASFTLFLGVVELDFYREFNQRLNGLVFQYMKEDPKTVLSMVWFGFPVLRYLLAWALATWLLVWLFRKIDRWTQTTSPPARGGALNPSGWPLRLVVLFVCLALAAVAGRGTLRQGGPMRWGDAYTTESMFANQLGLNATLSLAGAAMSQLNPHRDNVWKAKLPPAEARDIVRQMLLTSHDTLVDAEQAAVRRDFTPPAEGVLPVRNVVVILFESLAGHSIGALGAAPGITPYFDKLAEEGLLFTRFFSNGTHTHQGMFASLGCFPNLPAFEYLMQTPEGGNRFSGLPQLLGNRQFDNVYVYNGDFGWDNQYGFFGAQGVTNFVGRMEFVNPVVFDPTWGVSDQDMFERAVQELEKKAAGGKPFYALLQTLSNHTPYPLPAKLPVEPVTDRGALNEHLTAMRYADWALGQFFEKVRKLPLYQDTLFVIVGDHGFSSGSDQLTELNLARFNVPLLLIAPGIRGKFGARRDTVGTQIDIVPTIMGRLGGTVRHQCWGRDLLSLPPSDKGFGVIKPSGGEQIVGIVSDDRILIKSPTTAPKVYDYRLGEKWGVQVIENAPESKEMNNRLEAFLQTATRSLLDNTAGATGGKR